MKGRRNVGPFGLTVHFFLVLHISSHIYGKDHIWGSEGILHSFEDESLKRGEKLGTRLVVKIIRFKPFRWSDLELSYLFPIKAPC